MRRVEQIEAAYLKVKSSVETAVGGDEDSKDLSFQDIFALNNEIGKVARQVPGTMAKMRELQECVNMITVGLKYDKREELREGLALTAKAIRALKKEFDAVR